MPETFDEILEQNVEIAAGDRKGTLNRNRLVFNEANLSKFIEQEAVWYDHFGNLLAEAEEELAEAENEHEAAYAKKFAAKKEEGGSDKLVEAVVKSDEEIIAAKKKITAAKKTVKLLQQHLRSWDRCHDNAQSRGHMLRKEMDKLGSDIYAKNRWGGDDVDKQIDRVIAGSQEGS